jgi:hypothetical protein
MSLLRQIVGLPFVLAGTAVILLGSSIVLFGCWLGKDENHPGRGAHGKPTER